MNNWLKERFIGLARSVSLSSLCHSLLHCPSLSKGKCLRCDETGRFPKVYKVRNKINMTSSSTNTVTLFVLFFEYKKNNKDESEREFMYNNN